jgi:hypothetical protein
MVSTNLRLVVGFVGGVFLLSVVGIIALATMEKAIPDVLQNIAVGSMTLLGGLLVPSNDGAPRG